MDEKPRTTASKLIIPALVISRVAAQPHGLITALLLIEISQTFNIPIGVAGQLSTASSTVSAFMAFLMSFLAIKFNYRSLMMVGLAFYVASLIGNYLAPDFALLLVMYSLLGIGASMVNPMASAFVGTLLSSDKRARIISWFFAGMAVCVLVGAPYVTFIAGVLGWRANFLLFALPFALTALLLTYVAIPSFSAQIEPKSSQVSIVHGFKEIFTNRSAVFCMLCTILTETTWTVTPVYGITYMRQTTQLPLSLSWLILVGTSTSFMAGSLTSSRLVDKLGRRGLAVISSFIMGTLIASYLNIRTPAISVVLLFASCVVSSMRSTASESLALEQVPDLRGTVMSLNSIALSVGTAVGTGLGGLLWLSYGYGGLGALGLFSVAAAVFYKFWVVDPTK